MMKKVPPPASPDAYVKSLTAWRRKTLEALRNAVLAAASLEEVIKWGHLVYFENGPVLLIRAENERVLFGFWRGQRLAEIEPRLKKGGKYEMATLELHEGMTIDPATVQRLTREAIALNRLLGDPTRLPAREKQPVKQQLATKQPVKKQLLRQQPAKRAKKQPAKKSTTKKQTATSAVKKRK